MVDGVLGLFVVVGRRRCLVFFVVKVVRIVLLKVVGGVVVL